MGKTYESISPPLSQWLLAQPVFFVGTAPLAGDGHLNVSPKGLDSLRIITPHQVAYLDMTGSTAETIAHLRENGRVVLMFCAFQGNPKIVRLHGRGTVVTRTEAGWDEWLSLFAAPVAPRSVIVVDIERISDSCGYGVPHMTFEQDRDALSRWAQAKSESSLTDYRRKHNSHSIDGLPALGVTEV